MSWLPLLALQHRGTRTTRPILRVMASEGGWVYGWVFCKESATRYLLLMALHAGLVQMSIRQGVASNVKKGRL